MTDSEYRNSMNAKNAVQAMARPRSPTANQKTKK